MIYTKEQAIKESIDEYTFFGKFVKTNKGYYIASTQSQHKDMFPKTETPLSAGFVAILDGKRVSVRRERSSTLNMGPDARDVKGLGDYFNLPATKEI